MGKKCLEERIRDLFEYFFPQSLPSLSDALFVKEYRDLELRIGVTDKEVEFAGTKYIQPSKAEIKAFHFQHVRNSNISCSINFCLRIAVDEFLSRYTEEGFLHVNELHQHLSEPYCWKYERVEGKIPITCGDWGIIFRKELKKRDIIALEVSCTHLPRSKEDTIISKQELYSKQYVAHDLTLVVVGDEVALYDSASRKERWVKGKPVQLNNLGFLLPLLSKEGRYLDLYLVVSLQDYIKIYQKGEFFKPLNNLNPHSSIEAYIGMTDASYLAKFY